MSSMSHPAVALRVVLLLLIFAGCSPTTRPPTTPTPVLPNYAGTYEGALFVVNCQDALPGFCAGNVRQERDGQTEPITLTLTQSDRTVSGRMLLRGSDGTVTGTIVNDGRLHLTGTLPSMFDPINGPQAALEDWSSTLQGSMMVGSFNLRIFQGLSGQPANPLGLTTVQMRGIAHVP